MYHKDLQIVTKSHTNANAMRIDLVIGIVYML